MIVHKCWKAHRRTGNFITDTWVREGWFLFGFIPIFIRDMQNREKF